MAVQGSQMLLSPDGNYLAHTSPDGCLKIWETSSSCLKQEYTPSSHLSSTCSTFAWVPNTKQCVFPEKKGKKRKLNHSVTSAIIDLNLIAMGTLTGEILLYSVNKGDLYTQMGDGHTDVVNDICCRPDFDSIFSCSRDKHIIEWSIEKGKVKNKWKAGKGSIHSISVIDSKNLLSARSSIKWWDLETKTVLKVFTGHSSEISRLLPINMNVHNSVAEGTYFLSMAAGDRVINAWHLKEENDGNAVASFLVPTEPSSLSVSENPTKEQPLMVSVVTKGGEGHIFEHQLNGKCQKPLEPKVNLHITSESGGKKSKSDAIPILATRIISSSKSCQVVYGSAIRPIFETIEISDLERDTCLVRQVLLSCAVSLERGILKVKETKRTAQAKHLTPAFMVPSQNAVGTARKNKIPLEDRELSIEERLKARYPNNINVIENTEEITMTSDSLAHLILQGIQSNDAKMLETVFQCTKRDLIANSVQQLPVGSITPFAKVLADRLCNSKTRKPSCLIWFDAFVQIHKAFLSADVNAKEYIGPIFQRLVTEDENSFLATVSTQTRIENALSDTYTDKNRRTHVPDIEALATYREDFSTDEEISDAELEDDAEAEENGAEAEDSDADSEKYSSESNKSNTSSDSEEDMDL